MAWVEYLAEWERYRRIAVELSRVPTKAAINESEAEDALATAMVLRDSFADDPDVHALLTFRGRPRVGGNDGSAVGAV
jgi:hypothetical protein